MYLEYYNSNISIYMYSYDINNFIKVVMHSPETSINYKQNGDGVCGDSWGIYHWIGPKTEKKAIIY